jgi:5-methylcytosine-specific restriction endonuclease McrA
MRTSGWKWSRIAATIRQRDRACRWCGTTLNLDVDHVVEVRHGGTDDLSNLVALCADCHARKTAATQRAADRLVRGHYAEFQHLLDQELGDARPRPRPAPGSHYRWADW